MTIETIATQKVSQRRDSNSSNGYQESHSEDDGYFTSAVSVQHKTCSSSQQQVIGVEASSSSSCSTMDKNFKKVVWPNIQKVDQHDEHQHQALPKNRHPQDQLAASSSQGGCNGQADKPMAWMKNVAASEHHLQSTTEAMELEIQKRLWDATTGRRQSRSRSRSKNIMDRARSFERAAAEAAATPGSANNSRAPSRQGSTSNVPGSRMSRPRQRSPSAGGGRQMAEFWQQEVVQASTSRPSSRAGRERSVGRVDTTPWEIQAKPHALHPPTPKTPPPKRKLVQPPSSVTPLSVPQPSFPPKVALVQDHDDCSTPPPPPPPPRHLPSTHVLEGNQELTSIQTLSREEKEQIVEQWVQNTSSQSELEQFAYEIAETVVSSMEQRSSHHHQQQQQERSSVEEMTKDAEQAAAEGPISVGQTTQEAVRKQDQSESTKEIQSSGYSGVAHAQPAEVDEDKRRIGEKVQGRMSSGMRVVASEERQIPSRRSQTPSSLAKKTTFEPIDHHQPSGSFKKHENHFGMVKTGNVHEKRNFWLRSTEKLHEMSPGLPRRVTTRRLPGNQDWIRQTADRPPSRPGSSMGQAIYGNTDQSNVKKSVSGWSDLSKSKSSAAVLQQPGEQQPTRKCRSIKTSTPQEVFQCNMENDQLQKSVNLSEAHTNQVQETVTKWGKSASPQPQVNAASRTPSRTIGETFSETKTANSAAEKSSSSSMTTANAAPWRSSNKGKDNPEPSVKVVNVAVENNMRFSESAEAQMAKHLKQTSIEQAANMTSMTSTTSSSSSASSEKVVSTLTTQPPKSPGPSRKTPSSSQPATVAKGKSPMMSSSSPTSSRFTAASTSNSASTAEDTTQKRQDPILLSSSSGQISMSSSKQIQQVTTEQRWEVQQHQYCKQEEQIHEISNNEQSLPLISSWIKAEEEHCKKPAKPSRTMKADNAREEMPPPPPPPMPPPQLPLNSGTETGVEEPVKACQSVPSQMSNDEDGRKQLAEELVQVALAGKVNQLKDNLGVNNAEDKQRDAKVLEARARMLQEVASLRSSDDTTTATAAAGEDDDFNSTSQERAAEKAKQERNRELAEIAEMRCRTNWEDVVSSTACNVDVQQTRQTPDPDLEEARNTIRNAAARWQEREQSTQKVRYGTPPSGRTTPSRRIGNLFKKGSDHWSMDDHGVEEEFPAPPTDIEMEVTLPAPPPRDSSRDVMMEYAGKRRNS